MVQDSWRSAGPLSLPDPPGGRDHGLTPRGITQRVRGSKPAPPMARAPLGAALALARALPRPPEAQDRRLGAGLSRGLRAGRRPTRGGRRDDRPEFGGLPPGECQRPFDEAPELGVVDRDRLVCGVGVVVEVVRVLHEVAGFPGVARIEDLLRRAHALVAESQEGAERRAGRVGSP